MGNSATYRSDARGSARGSSATEHRWNGHPVATIVLRVGIAVAPVAAALGVVALARTVVPVPATMVARLAWGLTVSVLATVTIYGVGAAGARLLPLAALLRLSLVFPDRAPSRFRMARRTATVRQAEARVAAAMEDHTSGDRRTGRAIKHCLELVGALAHHDRITRGHCERVRAYCELIGEELGLDLADRQRLQWAGLLHDVGKVGVPAAVLNKRGKLTAAEWEQIRRHPEVGAQLTRDLEPWLGDWVRGVGEHHERWDGDGYPAGLRGAEISLAARIIAVADAFDVMTAARSYKDPLPADAARAELVRCAGTQFDEDVVRAFVAVSIGRLRRVMGPSAALAQVPVIGSLLLGPGLGAAGTAVSAAAVVVGGLVAPLTQPMSTPAGGDLAQVAASATREIVGDSGGDDSALGPAVEDPSTGSAPDPAEGEPALAPSTPTTTVPVGPGLTTTPPPPGPSPAPTAPPGLLPPVAPLAPVVDPVTDGVVDPVVGVVDDTVPGLDLGGTLDDLICAVGLLGCR